MKLVVFCLLAVCWCTLADTNVTEVQRKLEEVMIQLRGVKESLQNSEQELYTPPKNIGDCCCLPALRCFRANLQLHFNVTERRKPNKQSKQLHLLYNSLRNPITVSGLNFCNAGNAENATSTCQDCHSHPKEKAREFFSRLESLIQRAIIRLN